MRSPWTHDELRAMRLANDAILEQYEAEEPSARPLPPLAEEECRDLLNSMVRVAEQRALRQDESFLFGQLLAQYRMAIEARMLGKHGRYYVISEADILRNLKERL